MNRVLVWLME